MNTLARERDHMHFQISAFCGQGIVRTTNDDVATVDGLRIPEQRVTERTLLGKEDHLLLVADGLGGHNAGDIASSLAVEQLAKWWRPTRHRLNLPAALCSANRMLHIAISEEPSLSGMGTTIAGVHVAGSRFRWFNVGDSRVYLFRAHRLRQLSVDHAVGADDIYPPGTLTQCLAGTTTEEDIRPNFGDQTLYPRDTVLVCTDGVSGVASATEIAHACEGVDVRTVSSRLLRQVWARGAPDNVAVIVMRPDGLACGYG